MVISLKLLVMSDSHQNIERMRYAARQTSPDAILHLGDHISDAQKLSRQLPNSVIYMVKGNCDFQTKGQDELFLIQGNVKILMTHGHTYGVKRGLADLIERARQLGADLALYGHTHRAALRQENGLWLMCPGQMERHDDGLMASYGVVAIEDGSFVCGIEMLPRL